LSKKKSPKFWYPFLNIYLYFEFSIAFLFVHIEGKNLPLMYANASNNTPF